MSPCSRIAFACSSTCRTSRGILREILVGFRKLIKEALDHHPGGSIDEALADGGERAADLDVACISDLCAAAVGSELEFPVSLHKADFAFAFHDETETG